MQHSGEGSAQQANIPKSRPNAAAQKTPKKKAKPSPARVYQIMFFSIVGTLFWQSAATAVTHYQMDSELDKVKRSQAVKVAEIEAARKQLQGVATKLALLAKNGNQNAAEIIARFKSAGVDIRLDGRGKG